MTNCETWHWHWGVVIYNKIVTWTALAIFAMFLMQVVCSIAFEWDFLFSPCELPLWVMTTCWWSEDILQFACNCSLIDGLLLGRWLQLLDAGRCSREKGSQPSSLLVALSLSVPCQCLGMRASSFTSLVALPCLLCCHLLPPLLPTLIHSSPPLKCFVAHYCWPVVDLQITALSTSLRGSSEAWSSK